MQGLRDRDKAQEHIYRRMTFIISLSGMNGEQVRKKFPKLWPMDTDATGEQILKRGRKIIDQHRQYEALNKANEKLNARRIKNTG